MRHKLGYTFFIVIFLFNIGTSQSKYYFGSVGRSTFDQNGINYDSYDMITSYKVGFGREFLTSKYGFSYNFYFSSIGAYHNFVDTTARLPYIGVNPNFIFQHKNLKVNSGLYFAYCLYRKSPSNWPEAYYYYKKTDFGFIIQPEIKIFNIGKSNFWLTSEIFGSILPIFTTNVGSRPLLIHESTRNFGFSIGLKCVIEK